ncbi:iron ABC transporter permease [Arthrobacter gyeryongensis]|uniref:Iron ABC transporter permease n=1 Tax=Arthrobacter gyeryongensis TaxID=1650592 RepID=A0ABP9SD11_9MICC
MTALTTPTGRQSTTADEQSWFARQTARLGLPGVWTVYAVVLGAAVIIPIALFFAPALTDGGSALDRLLHIPDIGQTMATTVLLAVGATILGTALSVVLAVLASKVPSRIRSVVGIIPLLPLVVPPIAFVYGWIFVFDPRVGYANTLLRGLPFWSHADSGPVDIYTLGGILFVNTVEVSAVVFAFVDARLREINGSVEAAARIAGASPFRSFLTITLPLLRPALVAGLVVAFLLQLGQFTAPLFLGSRDNIQVITTAIFQLREGYPIDYPLTAALGLPLLVFGIIAIIVQRRAVGDQRKYVTLGSGRGIEAKLSGLSTAGLVAYGVLFIGVPIAAAALVALSPYWNGRLDQLQLGLTNIQQAFADPTVPDAIFNGLEASITASLIVTALGFIGSLAISGVLPAPRLIVRVIDFIFIAPLAVPRALLGVVVLFVFIQPPFNLYGTLTIYIIGYIFVALPLSMRSQYSSLIGVQSSLFEASRICGASQLRTVAGIAVPVAFRGMVASFAMSFVFLSNDVAVSLMIQAPGKEVVGTKLYTLEQAGTVPEIAVLALVMTVITAAILSITFALAGRSALENL